MNSVIVLVGLPRVAPFMASKYNMHFEDLYNLIALNLDRGNGYRVEADTSETMLREPGYPLLLAAVFKIAGYGIQQARLACILLAFGAALMIMKLTRKITDDRTSGAVSAILFLLYPGILIAESRAGVEIASIFTVVLFMLVLHNAVEKKKLWLYGAVGILLGVAVLVRSEVLLFPAFLGAYLLLTARGWHERRKVLGRIAVLAAGITVAMSPWVVRNYLLVHRFVPTATVAGVAAQEGLYTCENLPRDRDFFRAQRGAGLKRAEVARRLGIPFVGSYYYQLFYTPQDEVLFNQALIKGVSLQYREDPPELFACASKNLLFNFWFLGKRRSSTLLNVLVQAPLLMLSLIGIVVLWKRGLLRKAGMILLYVGYVPLIHAPIIAHARHSMLVVPFLALLAAPFVTWALSHIWPGIGTPQHQKFLRC